MSDEWVGIAHSTKPRYMKGASDLTKRKRLFLAMLNRRGRLSYNNRGEKLFWQVEFSQPPVEAHSDGGVIDFSNHDAFRQLSIDWRGYIATDTLTKKQNAMNSGDEALINLFQTKSNRLTKSIQNNFAGEMYRDGSSAGRENAIHGCETVLAETTPAATDRLATPNDTYGDGALSTVLGNQGGSWSANLTTFPNATLARDWPDGNGDTEYDFLSPKLVNWSSTNWGTGSALWEDNCWRVISQMITWLTMTGDDDGMPDICVLASNLFQGYKNHEEAIRRISIPHKVSNDLGFAGNVLNQDGCAISADYDCPANTGYMFNTSTIEVKSMFPELFWMEGPDKDPRTGWSWLWGVGFYGNVTWSPKFLGKTKNFA